MRMTLRYLSDISNLPGDILAEIFLCIVLLGKTSGLHPLWLIIFAFLINMDSLAMQGDVLGKGNSLMTYSLPFSRAHLWISRAIITLIMYLIPAAVCIIFDRVDITLLCTEELILLSGLLAAGGCLRSMWWILIGAVLGVCSYLFYIGLQFEWIGVNMEVVFQFRYLIFIALSGVLMVCTICLWKKEQKIFTKGGRR